MQKKIIELINVLISYTVNATFLYLFKTDSWAEELLDVWHSELNHCWPFQTQSPCNHRHVFWETHWSKHFWPENSRVTNLYIHLQYWMYALIKEKFTENLHRRFSVRIVSWLEPNVLNTDLFVELSQNTNQVVEAQISVNDESFYLMEFSQVSIVQRFVSEHSVDWEELSGSEWFFLGNLLQNSWWNCSCVGSQDILVCFFWVPFIIIS